MPRAKGVEQVNQKLEDNPRPRPLILLSWYDSCFTHGSSRFHLLKEGCSNMTIPTPHWIITPSLMLLLLCLELQILDVSRKVKLLKDILPD
jgi:hypothetical protein